MSRFANLLLVLICAAPVRPAGAEGIPSYSRDIRPLLSDRCFKCHGPDDQGRKGGLRLDLPEAARLGGKSGAPAILPGNLPESEILKRMHSTDPDEVMPPPAMKKALTPAEIRLFEEWIAAGAKYEKHWAFEAPVSPAVPAPAHPAWPLRNEVDAFVQPLLIQAGLTPAAEADRTSLFRRVSFDLTGLPPTPEATAGFLADPSPQAYEQAVDRLLASPHYGEKWARKWLDLARYADTNGYEKDRARTIWPWRDWVIRALNADLPFDRFTIEQIAGDLLPNSTTDQLIATGFHRNTMLNEEGGIDPLEFRYYAMVDRVATTSAAWLGLTLQCAQCHTHKYDPVTHREYFSMMAFLNNADEPDLPLPDPAFAQQEKTRTAKLESLLAALPSRWQAAQVRTDRIDWQKSRSITAEPNPADPATVDPAGGTVSFAAPGPDKTKVTLVLTGLPENATHLRLEALTDDALPGQGPGRTPHGNFVLSEIEVQSGGHPVPLRPVSASAEQKGYPLSASVDGKLDTGWAVDEGTGKLNQTQSAVFAFAQPLPGNAGLTVTLQQQFGRHHTLGRLKLMVGTAATGSPPGGDALAKAVAAWVAAEKARTANWKPAAPVTATSNLPLLTMEPDASVFVSGDTTKMDAYQLGFANLPDKITAVRLEALPDPRLPANGPGMAYYEGPKGDFFMGEFQLSSGGQRVKFSGATESYAKNNFGGSASALLATDGDPETGWSCAEGQGRAHEAVFVLERPLQPVDGKAALTLMFGRHFAASLGKFRLSFTTSTGDLRASLLPSDLQPFLTKGSGPGVRARLEREFLLQAPELAEARKEIDQLRKPARGPVTLVMRERPDGNPRPTFMHHRGEFTQPTDRVEPGVLRVLNPLPPGAPVNRLTFARWLVSRDQPLTARVVVNRAWAAFFGRGLVKTQEDFGYQGELPSHPALLDWLAVRLMEDGWSMKQLHRRIVLSHTYRQSSRDQPAAAAADPENKWLWRGPRLRLDAEEVRDAALQASGLLSKKMFGPGVYPPQPASVTTEGTYGSLPWTASTGEDRYRRSLYTYAKRTAPFAFTTTFDAPAGDACIVRRDRSNTPLQALSLLNDVTIMEAAAAFGQTLAARSGPPAETLAFAFQRCFSRAPDAEESAALLAFFEKQLATFQTKPESARELAGKEAAPSLAAWTLVCRTLLNLDEFVTKS